MLLTAKLFTRITKLPPKSINTISKIFLIGLLQNTISLSVVYFFLYIMAIRVVEFSSGGYKILSLGLMASCQK